MVSTFGLPAGFLQAGMPGVVGTLWPVSDLPMMLLMVRFYRYHLRGDEKTGEGPMAPARALRRAQLWLRDVTCGDLMEVFDGFRQEAAGGTRMTYVLAQEWFRKYALSGDAGERSFVEPYYWAPFVFYGRYDFSRLNRVLGSKCPEMKRKKAYSHMHWRARRV